MELPQTLVVSAGIPESAQNLGVDGVAPWLGLRLKLIHPALKLFHKLSAVPLFNPW